MKLRQPEQAFECFLLSTKYDPDNELLRRAVLTLSSTLKRIQIAREKGSLVLYL